MSRQMKESGIEWIGEIPKGWEICRLKVLGNTKAGLANKKPEDFGHGYPFISYKNIYKNIILDKGYPDLVESTEADRKNCSVLKGDAFFTGSSETIEELGFASMCLEDIPNATYNGFCIRFRPNNFDKYNLQFMKYCFRSEVARGYLTQNDNSITRANLSQKTLKSMLIVIPPIQEQMKIADCLDEKVSLIDRIIAKTTISIEEYKKYKQSLIRETVTKGLNPDAEMKDSEIDWIGKIPKGWAVTKIKNLCSMKSGTNLTSLQINDKGSYRVYGGNGIRGYYLEYNQDGNYILIGRQGALCGNIHLVQGKFWATEHAVVTTCRKNVEIKYCKMILETMNLNQYSIASAQPGLAISQIINLGICLPPYYEQQKISEYLDGKCNYIDKLIAQKQQLRAELQTYKKSLIYECVTGKREVV